jgi:hypothetical protein
MSTYTLGSLGSLRNVALSVARNASMAFLVRKVPLSTIVATISSLLDDPFN